MPLAGVRCSLTAELCCLARFCCGQPDYITFNAGGMDLVLGVYSPTGKYKAADF